MTPVLLLAAGLTLADLEGRLLSQNPEYKQAEAAVRMAEGKQLQAGLYPNPTIGGTGEHVSKATRGGSIGGFVEQQIVMGGKLGIDRGLAGQELERARAMQEAWRLRLRGQLMASFYETLTAGERTRMRAKLTETAADSLKIAKELKNIGRLDEPEIRSAEVEAQRAELRLAQAKQMERRAWTELAALLNVDVLAPQELDGLVDDLPALQRDALWSRIRAQSPEAAMAVTERARAEFALRQAKAARIPDLRVRGGLRHNSEFGDVPGGRPVGVEGIFDVGIEIPIFNRQQGNLKAARAGLERSRLESTRTERALQARFAAAWQRYESAMTAVERYRGEMLPAARQAFETYQRNFRGMQAEYSRVLSTQRTYFGLQDEYIDSLREGWRAAAELESLLLLGQEAGASTN
ncbi:MAG: TolC family protein [Acidobacteria bacterium]|nr:TolC family protein [Acidobacteriota bacterium]